MKVHHSLICFFFFLALQDGNTGLVNAQTIVYSRTEGQDVIIQCPFSFDGSIMVFCKKTCQEKVLIGTPADRDQRGRYSIQRRPTSGGTNVLVAITNLMKSDSGLYECGLIGQRNHEYKNIEIVVDARQDVNSGLANAQTIVYSGIEGQDVRFQCPFSFVGWRMYFCKETCQENVLFDTIADRDQRGRYSIQHSPTSRGTNVFVTITNLVKSDSGRYRCGLIGLRNEYNPIRIIVVDAVLERNPPEEKTLNKRPGGNVVVQCFFSSLGSRMYFCRDDCKEKDILVRTSGDKVQNGRYSIEFIRGDTGGFVYVSITQLKKSDSGRYRCAVDRPLSLDPYYDFSITVTDGVFNPYNPTTSGPDLIPPATTTSVPSVVTLITTAQETEPTPPTDRTTSGQEFGPQSPTTSVPSVSKTTITTQETEPASITGAVLYTVVCLVIVVIVLGLVLIIICIQWKSKPEGLITRENANNTNMEMADYENCPPPVSSFEDVTYLTLHPATRDQNQTYSTLTHTKHT